MQHTNLLTRHSHEADEAPKEIDAAYEPLDEVKLE